MPPFWKTTRNEIQAGSCYKSQVSMICKRMLKSHQRKVQTYHGHFQLPFLLFKQSCSQAFPITYRISKSVAITVVPNQKIIHMIWHCNLILLISMQEGHVLKFALCGKTIDQNTGIRTFPRQTYGVSEESPEEFQHQFTLIGEHGYIYRHQNRPEYYYPSQRKSFNINSTVEEEDYTKLHIKLLENSQAFHRKKGRLSQFMDKNGWMSPVIPIMGYERTEEARYLSNRDREQRIRSLKLKPVYESKSKQPKVNQEYFNTIPSLMSQRLKIRKQRNLLNEQNLLTVRVEPKKMQKKQRDPIHVENVVQNMAKTSLDFYSTSSTFYKRNQPSRAESRTRVSKASNQSPSKSFRSSIQKRAQSPSKSYKDPSSPTKNNRMLDVIEREDQNVQNWYRQTCQSKWAYKPKDIESDEEV